MPSPEAANAQVVGTPAKRATFGEVFAIREFRALWVAQILSIAGDQLARVALTLLVFDRTHSALLAAITFAASVVPEFVGGIALSGLADRLPRRTVMIVCDILRAGLVAVMALPRMPVAALVTLLFVVTMVSAPFTSARAGLYPDILRGDRYVLGTAITHTTVQVAQVLGFAAGGAVVALFRVRISLAADAGTFLVSALIVVTFIQARPAADPDRRQARLSISGTLDGIRLVFSDPRLRMPMLLGWLVAFVDIYEGVAAPLARRLGGGALATGMILASGALGASAGAILFSRLVGPEQRIRWMSRLAVLACAVLTLFAFRPNLPFTLILLMVSGGFCCYQIAASAAFVTASPAARRSQAFGVAQGGITLAQGTAMIIAGAATRLVSPSLVIAVGGALGVVVGTAIAAAGACRR